ncbi:uncharacterized protein H6S33_003547 [Morchella sextelata]|uniref:uncharacterized protein n=1 Tax=Morchella sextelata TaxID=1174677 RepID=UPI001D048222|nr:uncharacterized protein H6S33_003547 [Morchella sextelata]KAH0606713.1 hypothetical protein H6S33_003547 [Morchella sextelata]
MYPSLPSPAPSDVSTTSYHTLPHPRSSGPLKAGSRPESNLIAYLDVQLLEVSRKYAKKFHEGGYFDIKTIAEDLERLVDVLWVSSTPTLQIHYMLQMANSFNDYLASFPPHLKVTLRLLDTFDRCFYTLITETSADPSTPLPPAFSAYQMNMTEKVRLKSMIERTRLHVVKLLESGRGAPDPLTENAGNFGERNEQIDIDTENETEVDGCGSYADDEELEIEVSKVYDRCMVQLGEGLKTVG